jgi:hypothetical protein
MLKIYYTLIYLGYKSEKSGKTVGISAVGLQSSNSKYLRWKVSEISAIYWNYLLKWIDFQSEIGHDTRFVGDKKTNKAKYLFLIYFLGSGLD